MATNASAMPIIVQAETRASPSRATSTTVVS